MFGLEFQLIIYNFATLKIITNMNVNYLSPKVEELSLLQTGILCLSGDVDFNSGQIEDTERGEFEW